MSPEKEIEIFNAHFNKGIKRSEIKRMYKINDFQFSQLVRKIIKKEISEKYPTVKRKWVGRLNGGWVSVK